MGDPERADRRLELLGRTLVDRYRIDALLGIGGMGLVFKAHHLQLKRDVAIKVLNSAAAGDADSTGRFMREAESAARLDHDNCLRVYDFGVTPDGVHYMVMPILDGVDMATSIPGSLSPRRVAELALQLFAGLEHAHERSVIHRDIKPQNLFTRIEPDDTEHLVIADFGVAKILEGGDPEHATRSGLVVGTPAYMSPEQAAGLDIDERTDLFSAGLILHRWLTGVVPMRARNSLDQIRMRAALDVPPLDERFPEELRVLCDALCKRLREERLGSAREAREQVEAMLANWEDADERWDRAVGSNTDATAPDIPTPGSTAISTVVESSTRTRAGTIAGAIAVSGLGLVLWTSLASEGDSAAAPATVTEAPPPRPATADEPGTTPSPPQPDPEATPELSMLEKVSRVNEADPEVALPYEQRRALLRELEADPQAAEFIDHATNLGMDLLQASAAPDPCAAFADALAAIEASRDREFLGVLTAAEVPAADGANCDGLASRLGRVSKTLKRRGKVRRPVAKPPAPPTGQPSEARPVKVTEKLDG